MKVLMVHEHSAKMYAWETSGSQVIAKNGSWPMRFYSLIDTFQFSLIVFSSL